MNKFIAILAVGAALSSLQLNAQNTKTAEEQPDPRVEQDILNDRAQPSADYQHNQYGTYPQGDADLEIIPQTKTEISPADLPESVLSSFENSEYSNQEIVAVYEVKDDASAIQSFSDEVVDPTYHNDLNERSRVESGNSVGGESIEKIVSTTQYEIEVKDENTNITLTYSEEGELKNASEESDM
ncbi:hypothetical protein [Tunicatimonas pelagia]|uniref:hypothetical protein n=1 Tax=Tunicatimonas pelagia TaxID=931531 RepID=UPI002665C6EE|nr:hypothetical protein [Tunicatimonas pelagia]WKN40903.1 hypothetical protein P0M28_17860 [Tunicatimonas pelagia]